MKNTKKFAAMIAALTLSACSIAPMAMTASAAVSLTMTSPTLPDSASIQSEVKAYEVFKIEVTGSTAGNNKFTSVTGWGDGVNSEKLLTAIKVDNIFNVDGANVFAGIDSADSNAPTKVVEAINKLTDEQLNAFAGYVISNKAGDGVTGQYVEGNVDFESLTDGYYAISCTVKDSSGDKYTSQSLGMLTVVDNEAVNVGKGEAKVGLPTVQKKVQEDVKKADKNAKHESEDELSWNDVADYDIGDPVPFKLYGTMPSNLDKYGAYYYEFVDTLGAEFDMPTSMTIKVGDTELKATSNEDVWTVTGEDDNNCRVTVKENVISISFENIKAYTGVDKDTLVTVVYDAVLNANAKIGKPGQENAVSLKYSNNPNFKYTPDTEDETPDSPGENEEGDTPDDKVKVYTYALEVEKTFWNGSSPLTVEEIEDGVFDEVTFNLKKGDEILKFRKLVDGEEGYGTYDYVVDKNGKEELKLTEIGGADGDLTTKTDNKLVVRIKGLDDGTYTLSEVGYPSEYNQAPDQTIKITAGTVNDQTWNGTDADETLESFKWQVGSDKETTGSVDDTLAKTEVQNKKGLQLPSTGGIGTTIFYLGGGAMVAVAGVFLITKKRMGKSEN